MKEARIIMLEQFISEEPENPFNFYALAMEYLNDDLTKSLEKLVYVEKHFPEYLGTYYQLGKIYQEFEKFDWAEMTFKKGIEISKTQKNTKTEKELIAALKELDNYL